MAKDYTIVTQYPDVETDGGSVARQVMVVGTLTNGHGVYFENRYPRAGFKISETNINSEGYTIQFEDLFTIPGVDAVEWGQKLNSANQLQDWVTLYYVSTSGDSSNFLEFPFKAWTQDHVAALVKAGVAELDAGENV